eukprot:364604-Chlamydomonas_euryale.AAC.22
MHSCRTSLPGVARSHPSVRATPTSRRGSSASATSGLGLWGAVTGLVGSLARGTSARTMAYAEGPKWWDSSSVAVVTGANKVRRERERERERESGGALGILRPEVWRHGRGDTV